MRCIVTSKYRFGWVVLDDQGIITEACEGFSTYIGLTMEAVSTLLTRPKFPVRFNPKDVSPAN